MQLVIISLALFLLVFTQDLKAQLRKFGKEHRNNFLSKDSTEIRIKNYENPDWKTVNIDFLSSYYAQNGNHAAVTGGIGTEQLTDFTQKIIIAAPLTPKLSLNLDAGYDYYSSASTDNIDNIRSSDSSSDTRIHGNVGINYSITETQKLGVRIGGSSEYDYLSVSGGLTYGIESKDKNTAVNLGLQAFFDTWSPYYPAELENTARVATDQRRSYNGSIGVSRVLNKKMQLFVQAEAVYMQGLLSTPFHRVYFQEQSQARIENLPDNRLKIPIGARLNTYVTDWMLVRSYYRFYWDNWGVKGHTASIEIPFKVNRFLAIYPFYRFHTQTAADYFKPYKEHSIQDTYYTSDHDLAVLNSHAYGVGLSYSPANGIARIKVPLHKGRKLVLSSIDFKYSHYTRSTDLSSNIVSLGLKFNF